MASYTSGSVSNEMALSSKQCETWEGTFMSLKEVAKLSITSNSKRITRSEFK